MTMQIFLAYYDAYEIDGPSGSGIIKHPLARRMSPIQRASASVFIKGREAYPDFFSSLRENQHIPIIVTTSYGEIEAIHSVARSVTQSEFPLSPKDFQHSVANASSGYLALTQELHSNIITLSNGFLSLDKALYFGAMRLARMPDPYIVIIHAGEHLWPSGPVAKAEMFVLCREQGGCLNQALGLADFKVLRRPFDVCYETAQVQHHEAAGTLTPCFNLPEDRASHSFDRLVTSATGEALYSRWVRCS
jgi:hypothetical protein